MPGSLQDRGRALVASFLLFVVSLGLAVYSNKNTAATQVGGRAVATISRPFYLLFDGAIDGVSNYWNGYISLIGVQRENQQLLQRIKELESERSVLLEMRHENEQLQSLLKMRDSHGLQGVVARVIGYDPSSWVQGVLINRGSDDGIEQGMAVVDGRGVVGQVALVTPSTARIILVTDHASGIDAIVQDSRARGVVWGAGLNSCELRYVVKGSRLEVGSRIVTSGVGQVYPPGLLVGTVARVGEDVDSLFAEVDVTPAVNLNRLEKVFVVTAEVSKSVVKAGEDS